MIGNDSDRPNRQHPPPGTSRQVYQRSTLRSSLTDQLDPVAVLTAGDRSFAVAGARLWNSLLCQQIVACDTYAVTFLSRTQNISI